MADENTSILVVGGGTFGLSTAYHLAKAGYKSITVLEKSPTIPPEMSAGNDLNKIVRAEYEDAFYTGLALEAIEEWKTPLFAPYFHQTGYLLANSSKAPEKSKISLAKALSSISSHPAFRGHIRAVNSRDDIRSIAPVFTGPMRWTGYFNRYAGYAHASGALKAVYSACCALGVDVRLGEGAQSLLFGGENDNDGPGGNRCVGVRTASGREYRADRVVLALGASLPRLLPQVGRQVAAKAWSVGHVQLTPSEASRLRGIPVTYARDLGFFFEPDSETGLLKLCPSGAGYTNFAGAGGAASIAPEESEDWIPEADVARIRALLRETLPELADRPLVRTKLCWCADTADSEYVVDFVPETKGLVVVAGDSGHAFKMLPIVGRWVRDVLEKGRQDLPRWRWKEGSDATGGDVSWRVGKVLDLKDVRVSAKL
ncbi:hypothetical protein VTK73DRAFT_212 [Phialemonium thermophilum]|uniref:FAD dependent oxidoreductase domain-containing protein n=1 Tax=Phialemonium thermophilum TaxID=223376 RepID=A0ABR3VWE9_9PEZI